MTRKIGLLGGIGPEATGAFYLDLIVRLQKSGRIRSNADFPQILINSIPAPELVYAGDLDAYIKGLKELDAADVDLIAMLCNTVHSFYDTLQKEVKAPIIDLRREVSTYLKNNGIKSVVLLTTPMSHKAGLYRDSVVKYYEPEENELNLLGDAVLNFNSGTEKEKQAAVVQKIARRHVDAGAELVVCGCTELSLMMNGSEFNKLDTMELLAEAVVRRCFDAD